MSRWLYYGHAQDLLTIKDEHVRNARHACYGMCSYLDAKVGRIMATLNDMDLADDTIVLFVSDHGEMLGERGMWFKQSFYEDSVRVPLIIAQPGRIKPGRVKEITSLLDLLPTFIDWGTDTIEEPVTPLAGKSLTSLLAGDTEGWDNAVISEYTGEGVIAPCRMVRRGDYKYIYTHGHPSLLYNLAKDPLEVHNLSGNSDYAATEVQLHDELMQGWDPEMIMKACIQSQKERRFIQGVTNGNPTWAYVSRSGDDVRFVRNASAVGAKAMARYPYVKPTPFEH